MWDDGDGGGVSALQCQKMIRGSGSKISGKIKVREMAAMGIRREMTAEEEIAGSMSTAVVDMRE